MQDAGPDIAANVASGSAQSAAAPATAATPRSLKQRLRLPLMILGPLLVAAIAGYFYLTGGRYVSTDNAYVKADRVAVAPQVGGAVSEVLVRENQQIAGGALLARIDPKPFRLALDRADAQLRSVVIELDGLKVSYQQKLSEIEVATATEGLARREYERQLPLARSNFLAQSRLDQSRVALHVAEQRVAIARKELEQIRVQLMGDPALAITSHPKYLAAKAARDAAALDLERTAVRAPFDGIATKVPMLGQQATAGTPLLIVVSTTSPWIEANFKETDLTNVRPGQPASIQVDTYPGKVWKGRVDSISQATGSEFAVLPAQNASGNWVKVVQRIPVRIAVDMQPGDPPLRVGMSTYVEIDTAPSTSPAPPRTGPHTSSPAISGK